MFSEVLGLVMLGISQKESFELEKLTRISFNGATSVSVFLINNIVSLQYLNAHILYNIDFDKLIYPRSIVQNIEHFYFWTTIVL